MGEKETRRGTTSSLPFGLGETMRTTDIKDDEGHSGHGVGWTRDRADKNAEKDYENDCDEDDD